MLKNIISTTHSRDWRALTVGEKPEKGMTNGRRVKPAVK